MSTAPPVAQPASRRWPGLALFARFAVLKAGTQGLAVVQGFLVVNLLAKHEYGIYAIAFAAIGAAAVLAGAGLDMFVSSVGGRYAEDRTKFQSVARAAIILQTRMTWIGSAVLAAMLPFQLLHAEAGVWSRVAVGLLSIAVLWLQVRNGLQRNLLSIRLQIERNQILEMISSGLRIVGFLALAQFPLIEGAATFLALNLATLVLHNRLQAQALRGWVEMPINGEVEVSERQREAWTMTRQQLPNSCYWAFQGQIPYLLMSLFGSLATVAEIGRAHV